MSKSFPHTENHESFIDKLQEHLEKQSEPQTRKELTPTLAKELSLSPHTVNRWFSEHREQLENQGLTTEEKDDGSPGALTVYWKVKQWNDLKKKKSRNSYTQKKDYS